MKRIAMERNEETRKMRRRTGTYKFAERSPRRCQRTNAIGKYREGLRERKMWPRSTNGEGKWGEEIERRYAVEVERESWEMTIKGDCEGRSRK